MATAAKSTSEKRKGLNRTRRASTTAAGAGGQVTINIPNNADCIVIENVGANPVRIVFDTDAFTNHFEIKTFAVAGGMSRVQFAVSGGKDIQLRSTGGVGDIQYVLSG